eukprot:7292875-Prymnesium_polylepis.1
MNASTGAARGLPYAKELADEFRATDAQHLLHMPSHTYLRTGNYSAVVTQNVIAAAADERYLANGALPYGPGHDMAFLVYGACMAGMRGAAYNGSDALRAIYAAAPDRPDGPGPEQGWNIFLTTRVRFGDWKAIVAAPTLQPRPWPFAQVLRHYANGTALAQIGRREDALRELSALETALGSIKQEYEGFGKVARLSLLAATQAAPGGDGLEDAVASLRAAVAEQTSWIYDEPPQWHMPVRQCLGRLLLRTRRWAQAYDTFSADLAVFPANGYSLLGLAQSMIAQPAKYAPDQVKRVEAQMRAAWAPADVPLTTPCAAFDPPSVLAPAHVSPSR